MPSSNGIIVNAISFEEKESWRMLGGCAIYGFLAPRRAREPTTRDAPSPASHPHHYALPFHLTIPSSHHSTTSLHPQVTQSAQHISPPLNCKNWSPCPANASVPSTTPPSPSPATPGPHPKLNRPFLSPHLSMALCKRRWVLRDTMPGTFRMRVESRLATGA